MDRTERFHLIDQLLSNRRLVTRAQFLEALEVSPATFKRDLEYMRDRLGAPILWDPERRGYSYDAGAAETAHYQLPGLWFNTSEIQALLSMDALLENLQPGMLASHIQPLRARIRSLLDKGDHSVEEVSKRIRILPFAAKSYSSENFQTLCHALFTRKRLRMRYHSRLDDSESERVVSPQRLIYYRDNWYLDSWCHWRNALRSFSVDAIRSLEIAPELAKDIAEEELERELESGYGIFSGVATHLAKLRFSPLRARWVAREQWHPQQRGYYDESGHYLLEVPYSQDTELLMDVLKHGAEVEVLAPQVLRDKVIEKITEIRVLYGSAES